MTIAEEFAAAYRRAAGYSPELRTVPSRLAAAVMEVTGVDGAGLDVFDQDGLPVPIGASCNDTSLAEQLQFTVGQGPTYDAHRTGKTITATEAAMARTWPAYHDLLVTQTAFRSVVALPLTGPLASTATMDLMFHDPAAAASALLPDMAVLCLHITATLIEADLLSAAETGEDSGPVWLSNPSSLHRRHVMVAADILHTHLGVSTADALKMLKAQAYANRTTTDDVAADLISGRTSPVAFDLDD